jgi:hypothetical protein
MMLTKNELMKILSIGVEDERLSSYIADRIISLLDKQVQEAGWVVPVVMPRALEKDEEITMPATHEDVISGKAVRR